jgi:methylenetetrahydrofolate reductase (NADPH)
MAALEPICVSAPIISHITVLIRGQHDDQLVKGYGVGLAVNIIRKITSTGKIKGIHFCTLNLEKSVQLVIEKLQWADGSPTMKNRLIAVSLVNLWLRSSH